VLQRGPLARSRRALPAALLLLLLRLRLLLLLLLRMPAGLTRRAADLLSRPLQMNTVLDEAKTLAADVAAASKNADGVDVAVCVPFPFLTAVGDVLKDSKVSLGAQDCYYEDSGAYTAAVSTAMLKSVGTQYVLSGHSERRAVFGDSDADVNKKTLKILAEGLKCILCIGELKEERESGETFNVCDTQLTEGLKGVSAEMMKDIVIAYEPVWAIGTGLTATPEVAQETHAYIRSWFVDNYSQEVADNVVIQYGGSVNDANVDDLMACADIDGALVGGASLKAESFSRIVNFNKK
jgi:triosephosphate isomerase